MKESLCEYFPLDKAPTIHLSFEPELIIPEQVDKKVDVLFEKALQEKELVDNPLFCYSSHTKKHIFGKFLPYRYFVASREDPQLQSTLAIYPIGVSGITMYEEYVLVGKRDLMLSTYPGLYELVPSGSIETRACAFGEVDFLMQLTWELEEEAHIRQQSIHEMHPLGLFFSKDIGVYDIGTVIELSLTEFEKCDLEVTPEYPLLTWMHKNEFQELLDTSQELVVPLSKLLWDKAKNFLDRKK